MPVALEPGRIHKIVLDCDKDKPVESQPRFLVKAHSLRKQQQIAETHDAIYDGKNAEELYGRAQAALAGLLVGWENMGVEFTPEAIWDVLTLAEIRELIFAILALGKINREEKKSSESPA